MIIEFYFCQPYMSLILVLRKKRQGDLCDLEANLVYTVRPCLKTTPKLSQFSVRFTLALQLKSRLHLLCLIRLLMYLSEAFSYLEFFPHLCVSRCAGMWKPEAVFRYLLQLFSGLLTYFIYLFLTRGLPLSLKLSVLVRVAGH